MLVSSSRNHQASHDVPDEENLDESNEVIETETSVKKRQQRTSINLTGQLEASKKLAISAVPSRSTIQLSHNKSLPIKAQMSESEAPKDLH